MVVMQNIADDAQPNATMETRVAGQGQPKRVGRWTLAQLRQTDGMVSKLFLTYDFFSVPFKFFA